MDSPQNHCLTIIMKSFYGEAASESIFHHCMKSVLIWSYSGPYFAAFGLNMERYSIFLCISTYSVSVPENKDLNDSK